MTIEECKLCARWRTFVALGQFREGIRSCLHAETLIGLRAGVSSSLYPSSLPTV